MARGAPFCEVAGAPLSSAGLEALLATDAWVGMLEVEALRWALANLPATPPVEGRGEGMFEGMRDFGTGMEGSGLAGGCEEGPGGLGREVMATGGAAQAVAALGSGRIQGSRWRWDKGLQEEA